MTATQDTSRCATTLARSAMFAAITACIGLGMSWSLSAEPAPTPLADSAARAPGKALVRPLAQRDSTTLAQELAKYLEANGGLDDPLGNPAELMVDWLEEQVPGNEHAQSEVVSHFFGAIASTRYKSAASLLTALVVDLGVDYRRAVIKALHADKHPRLNLYAAMLTYRDLEAGDETANLADLKRYTAAALAAQPDDPVTLLVAAQLAGNEQFMPAMSHLTQIAPDNMFHWLPLMRTKNVPDAHAALHEAAQRTAFDDYFGLLQLGYSDAIESSAVPVPALLAAAATALAPHETAAATVARAEAGFVPLLRIAPLFHHCNPIGAPTVNASVRSDCISVGSLIARSPVSGGARVLSASIVLPLAKGTPLANEMAEVQRLHRYLDAMEATLSLANRITYPSRGFDMDVAKVGEFAARQRRLAHFGIPTEPWTGWQPGDKARPKSIATSATAAERRAN